MVAIPILALFGVFGESQTRARATTASLDMMVSYPSRFRYRQVQSLHVTVRNLTSSVADTVKVAFDTSYISRFSGVRFDPASKSAYVVDLTDVDGLVGHSGEQPGEARQDLPLRRTVGRRREDRGGEVACTPCRPHRDEVVEMRLLHRRQARQDDLGVTRRLVQIVVDADPAFEQW